MNEYDEMCVECFLNNQSQLFDERVASNMEEAEAFLEDCMAVVCNNLKEVRAYFEEEGADIAQMSDDDLEDASEVFALPDGRYLLVEAYRRRRGMYRNCHVKCSITADARQELPCGCSAEITAWA